ncbi:MAG: hypothetical protein ACLUVC_09690 [Longibaculum sp.]
MESTVDVLMVFQLNQILKEKGIEYSLHTIAGCSCCGMKLRCDGKTYDPIEILKIINEYLAQKWLVASYQVDNQNILYVDSKFHHPFHK